MSTYQQVTRPGLTLNISTATDSVDSERISAITMLVPRFMRVSQFFSDDPAAALGVGIVDPTLLYPPFRAVKVESTQDYLTKIGHSLGDVSYQSFRAIKHIAPNAPVYVIAGAVQLIDDRPVEPASPPDIPPAGGYQGQSEPLATIMGAFHQAYVGKVDDLQAGATPPIIESPIQDDGRRTPFGTVGTSTPMGDDMGTILEAVQDNGDILPLSILIAPDFEANSNLYRYTPQKALDNNALTGITYSEPATPPIQEWAIALNQIFALDWGFLVYANLPKMEADYEGTPIATSTTWPKIRRAAKVSFYDALTAEMEKVDPPQGFISFWHGWTTGRYDDSDNMLFPELPLSVFAAAHQSNLNQTSPHYEVPSGDKAKLLDGDGVGLTVHRDYILTDPQANDMIKNRNFNAGWRLETGWTLLGARTATKDKGWRPLNAVNSLADFKRNIKRAMATEQWRPITGVQPDQWRRQLVGVVTEVCAQAVKDGAIQEYEVANPIVVDDAINITIYVKPIRVAERITINIINTDAINNVITQTINPAIAA